MQTWVSHLFITVATKLASTSSIQVTHYTEGYGVDIAVMLMQSVASIYIQIIVLQQIKFKQTVNTLIV